MADEKRRARRLYMGQAGRDLRFFDFDAEDLAPAVIKYRGTRYELVPLVLEKDWGPQQAQVDV